MTISDDLERIGAEARDVLASALDADAVDRLRHDLLGRSGRLTTLLRQLGSVPAEERPAVGRRANELRRELEAAIQTRLGELEGTGLEESLASEAIDMSAPGGRYRSATSIRSRP